MCCLLYCTVLYCTVLYCTVLCCGVCCAVLCYAVLCCPILSRRLCAVVCCVSVCLVCCCLSVVFQDSFPVHVQLLNSEFRIFEFSNFGFFSSFFSFPSFEVQLKFKNRRWGVLFLHITLQYTVQYVQHSTHENRTHTPTDGSSVPYCTMYRTVYRCKKGRMVGCGTVVNWYSGVGSHGTWNLEHGIKGI